MSTAIVHAPFEPSNLEEAKSLATTLSQSLLLPDALRGKPSDVFVMLLTGRELGLSPMQSIRSIAVIKGKPSLSAELMAVLVRRQRDVCLYFSLVTSTDSVATLDRKSTRLNSSHIQKSRMPSSA